MTRIATQILGVGSPILADDGAGVAVVRRLGELGVPGRVTLTEGGAGGLSLLDMIQEVERLVVVDAMATGAAPGTIREFAPDEMDAAPTCHLSSVHGGGFLDALALREKLLGRRIAEVRIIGIEAGDLTSFSESLTPVVAEAVEQVARCLRREILTNRDET
ncbi:MAG: hydrogenase maturation protease [Desulfatibacillaceae bacterium]